MSKRSKDIHSSKEEIRKEISGRLRDQDPSLRSERSLIIQKKLLSSEEFMKSGTVMSYVALPTEVDTGYFNLEALRQGKRVAVPYIDEEKQIIIASELASIETLEKGPLGIMQPQGGKAGEIPLKEIDLIVIPAIAFDQRNMRLGRGKGYYDRFLSDSRLRSAAAVGLGFSFQVLQALPSDPHDRPVHKVITD